MGHHNRHYAGDRHALEGAWSPPTSRANFCEEDYAFTRYVAEFINTLTNLAYVYFALLYMYGPGSHGLFAPKVDFLSMSLLVLGIASFLYHATLRESLQFGDEFAMLGLAWSLLQATLTVRQPRAKARYINISLALVIPMFSMFYLWSGKIIYHSTVFTSILVILILRGTYFFYWVKPAFPEALRYKWRADGRKAIFYLVLGYGLWYTDLEYCAELRKLREQIGLPWAWVLEFHGWWHILTAISASQFMDIVRELQEYLSLQKEE